MANIAGIVAYHAWYHLADLHLVKHLPSHQIVSDFSLEIWRVYEHEKPFWSGTFTNGNKKLIVDGRLVEV